MRPLLPTTWLELEEREGRGAGAAGHRGARRCCALGGADEPGPPTLRRPGSGVVGDNRLKHHRAVAARYDKLAVRYHATVLVAAINEWL
nr:hypothetical protein [Streptomyces caniscabiei]